MVDCASGDEPRAAARSYNVWNFDDGKQWPDRVKLIAAVRRACRRLRVSLA